MILKSPGASAKVCRRMTRPRASKREGIGAGGVQGSGRGGVLGNVVLGFVRSDSMASDRSKSEWRSDPRYARQTLLPDFGEAGQRRLAEAHVAIVGVGALGCASADLLARAGVGHITLIDRDVVERSNLQRQTLYSEGDIGIPKAEAAARRLRDVNSRIEIEPIVADFTGTHGEALIASEGREVRPLLLDGTDNFETRYLLNDLAVKHATPYLYAGVIATRGMNMAILPGESPCLRCAFPDPPSPGSMPTCETAGVLGPAVAIVAARQAGDALKLLLGLARCVDRALTEFDLWSNLYRRVDLGERRVECPCCGKRRFEFLEASTAADHTSLCGQDAVQISPRAGAIDLDGIAARWAPLGEVTRTRFMVRLKPSDAAAWSHLAGDAHPPRTERGRPLEISVFADARAIVRGTTKPEVARSIYARFVGA